MISIKLWLRGTHGAPIMDKWDALEYRRLKAQGFFKQKTGAAFGISPRAWARGMIARRKREHRRARLTTFIHACRSAWLQQYGLRNPTGYALACASARICGDPMPRTLTEEAALRKKLRERILHDPRFAHRFSGMSADELNAYVNG